MLRDLPYLLLRCLIITIVIELLVALILGLRKKDLINVILVNVITNPIVNIVIVSVNVLIGLEYRIYALIIMELFALISEALIYKKVLKYKKINWFIISLILNMSSYLFGEIVNYIL